MRIHLLIIVGVICTAGFGFSEDRVWSDKSLSEPVCGAISNRWFTGENGKMILAMARICDKSPVVVDVVTSSVVSSLAPKARFYQPNSQDRGCVYTLHKVLLNPFTLCKVSIRPREQLDPKNSY